MVDNLLDFDVVVHATDNGHNEAKAKPEPEGGEDQAKHDATNDTSTNADYGVA